MRTLAQAIAKLSPAEVRRRKSNVSRILNARTRVQPDDVLFPSQFRPWTTAEYVAQFERLNHLISTGAV